MKGINVSNNNVKAGLENKRHDVIINITASDNTWFCLDAIDTDGYLAPYAKIVGTITEINN